MTRARLAFVALLLLLLGAASHCRSAEIVEPAKVDALVLPLIEGHWLSGAAVGLISAQGMQTVGYGRWSDKEPGPPDARTEFEIGSITKVFTGLVLAQMTEEHQLALTDPVQKLLGDSMSVPRFGEREITLVDLSTHSSGLPRMPGNFKPKDPTDPFADYTVEQLAKFVSKHKLAREPGASYEYSNLAVGLLGHALALKNGTSYEEMVRRRICEPLGMDDTRITLDDDERARLAQGHDADGQAVANWNLPTLAGAGALRSTVDDMLKLLAANLGLRKTPFEAAIADSHRSRFKFPGGAVGLGWHLMKDGEIVWHNGGTGGYHSLAAFSPEKKVGVVLLANTASTHVDPLGFRLLELLTTGEAKPLDLPQEISLDAAASEPLLGKYQLDKENTLEVVRDGDALTLASAGGKVRIYPRSKTQFFCRAIELGLTFESDDSAQVTDLVLEENGMKTKAPRVK